MKQDFSMETIVALAKGRGIVYPGYELYGGLANSWDYGPYGVILKRIVKSAWWRRFLETSPHNVGLVAAILMNPQTWVASGHVGGFSDPLIDCTACKARFRADKLVEDHARNTGATAEGLDGWSHGQLETYIQEHGVSLPECG